MINFKRKWVVARGRDKNNISFDDGMSLDAVEQRVMAEFYYLPSVWEVGILKSIWYKLHQFKRQGFRFWYWTNSYRRDGFLEIEIHYVKINKNKTVRAEEYFFQEPLHIHFSGGADKLAPEAMDEFGKSFPADAAELALLRKDPKSNNRMGSAENVRLLGVPWEPFAGSFREKFLKETSKYG